MATGSTGDGDSEAWVARGGLAGVGTSSWQAFVYYDVFPILSLPFYLLKPFALVRQGISIKVHLVISLN